MADGYLIGENLRRHLGALIRRGDSLPEYLQNKRQPIEWFQQTLQGPLNFVMVSASGGVQIGGALWLGWPIPDPSGGFLSGNEERDVNAKKFFGRPAFSEAAAGTNFAIPIEPKQNPGFVRCAIGGVVVFRLDLRHLQHTHAIYKDRTQLQSASCGPIKLLWKQDTNPTEEDPDPDPTIGPMRWAAGVFM